MDEQFRFHNVVFARKLSRTKNSFCANPNFAQNACESNFGRTLLSISVCWLVGSFVTIGWHWICQPRPPRILSGRPGIKPIMVQSLIYSYTIDIPYSIPNNGTVSQDFILWLLSVNASFELGGPNKKVNKFTQHADSNRLKVFSWIIRHNKLKKILEWMTLTARDLLYKSFPNLLCRWHIWATRVLGLTNNYKQPAWGEGIM